GPMPSRDVVLHPVDYDVATKRVGQRRMGFDHKDSAISADELAAKQSEVADVGANIDEDLARPEGSLQPAGHGGLPKTIKQEPWRQEGVPSINQHLAPPASSHEGRVIPEVYRIMRPATLPQCCQLLVNGIQSTAKLL